jgi:hypothetical protein
MVEKWITKKKGTESKHVKISTDKKLKEVKLGSVGPNAKDYEEGVWNVLGSLSKITNIDELLLRLKRYSGTLGDYSAFNSILIRSFAPDATIVRSRDEWKYYGRMVNENAQSIPVLYPIGGLRKDGPGKVKQFIEDRRSEGLSDEAIDNLVRDKFNIQGGGSALAFSVGKVYDISSTKGIPGKASRPETEQIKANDFYNTLKKIAREHYTVVEGQIESGALGYTAHSAGNKDIPKIKVMKIPGENVEALHTLIHEMSHARLDHLNRESKSGKEKLAYGLGETEAELSTYVVGEHFGFSFKDDSAAYIKGWLDDAKSRGNNLGKENIDRVMNNARWLIQEISSKI